MTPLIATIAITSRTCGQYPLFQIDFVQADRPQKQIMYDLLLIPIGNHFRQMLTLHLYPPALPLFTARQDLLLPLGGRNERIHEGGLRVVWVPGRHQEERTCQATPDAEAFLLEPHDDFDRRLSHPADVAGNSDVLLRLREGC